MMRIRFFFVIALLSIWMGAIPGQHAMAQTAFGIAATVNSKAISEADVRDRIILIMASSGMPNTPEIRSKLRSQALDILIEEQLKIQEAEKNDLTVNDEEIANAFGVMAQQNNMEADQFAKVMASAGIPKSTLLGQIRAQIAWTKVVTNILRPRIDVTDADIRSRLDRLRNNIGKTEYQVSEIVLPVDAPQNDSKIKDMASKLIEEIKSGRAPFAVVAAQFSKSSSAMQGGSVGWVQEGDLPKELDVVVKSLSKGQISPPIQSLSGYYILTVTEQRQVSEENMPSEDEVLNSIGLQRLDRLQKRYLADIRSVSFIDRRDN